MALKIVQTVNKISPTISVASTSDPITLHSGYIRVSTGSTGAYVAIGTSPVATENDFHLPPFNNEVLKERLARQKITGITTGTTTVVSFGQNLGNVFLVGDYVSITDASPVGINTVHVPVIATTPSSVTIDFDSTVVNGVVSTDNQATLARSVKISALAAGGGGSDVSICEVVQLVSE
jgi:hypothetical protein